MTKQEEIREWLAQRHCENCMTDEQCREKRGGGRCKEYYESPDEELTYLHSKGVVLKVESDLPSPFYGTPSTGYTVGQYRMQLEEMGYRATHPLIEK